MKNVHTLRLMGIAGLGCCLLAPAPTFAQDGGRYYVGMGVGRSEGRIDRDRITAGLLSQGLTTDSMTVDEHGTAFKVFGGFRFNPYVAVEAGYFNLGKMGFTSRTTPAGSLTGQIKLQGVNLDLVGTLPVTERFSLLGRVGMQYASARDKFSGTGAVGVANPDPSQRAWNPKLGAGVQYAVTPGFLLRAEAERYRVNDAVGNRGDVNLLSVSAVFPLGRAPAARVAAAPAAAPPPPPPPPAPPPVVVAEVPPLATPPAPPPPHRRVSFSADSLFAFNRSTVEPKGRQALDRFAAELRGTTFEVVTVEGHADRLGTAAYNERLSLRRAEAVKAHLVGSGGVAADRITAVGKGESEPVSRAEDCKGTQRSPKLIACLQADRRVVVEVKGTQKR